MHNDLTISDAQEILFPHGLCPATFNSNHCIIPATYQVDNIWYCEYHGKVAEAYQTLVERMLNA